MTRKPQSFLKYSWRSKLMHYRHFDPLTPPPVFFPWWHSYNTAWYKNTFFAPLLYFVPSLWWCKCSVQEIPSDLCRWRWQFKIRTYVLLFQSTFVCLFVSIPKKVYGKNELDSPLPCILNSNSFWFSARKSLTQYCRSIFSFPFTVGRSEESPEVVGKYYLHAKQRALKQL